MPDPQQLELGHEDREVENQLLRRRSNQTQAKRPKTMEEASRTSTLLRPIIWVGLKDR